MDIQELFKAVNDGEITIIEQYIKTGENIDIQHDFNGTTLLHQAVLKRKFDIVKLLLQNGADPNINMKFRGEAPLHFTIGFWENIEMANILLSYEADINVRNTHGWTPLHIAVIYSVLDETEVIEYLIEHGADINRKDYFEWTPLKWAKSPNIQNLLKKKGGIE